MTLESTGCSDLHTNISGCILDTFEHNMNIHENLRAYRKNDDDFKREYKFYTEKYTL